MSEVSGFFTSVTGDRKYTAQFMNEKLHEAMQRAEGVVPGSDGEFEVTTDGSLSVTIAAGTAFKSGIYSRNQSALTIPLSMPSLGTQRIDRLAVRIDRFGRTMRTTLIPGIEGVDPAVPDYIPDDDVPLAKVLISRLEDPPVVSVTDERQMRPRFLTDRNSLDDLADGSNYGKVLKEKADAINRGLTGVSFRQFIFTARPWTNALLEAAYMLTNGGTILVTRLDQIKLSFSKDAGMTWADSTGITIDDRIFSVIQFGSNLFAAGGAPARIFKSTDWGTSWVLNYEIAGKEFASALCAIDSTNGLAVSGDTVYATANGGSSWSQKGFFPDDYLITAMANLGNGVILAAGYYTDKIWRSTDSGATWKTVGTVYDSGNTATFIKHLGNGIVLLGYKDGGRIYRSTDYGLTWDEGRRVDEFPNYYHLFIDGDSVYLPVGRSIYVSTDGGATWSLKYTRANWSDIQAIGKNLNGDIVTLGNLGHIYWGYLMEA